MSLMLLEGDVATGEDDDVELTEFDEIESWVIEEFAKIGLILQKAF
jgi:N utilization substance protein A